MRIAFATFGCKINQYETDEMRRSVAEQGNTLVPFDSEADVYIINTCSVTGRSDIQCRQAIRAAARRSPGAQVLVTGCYAETHPDEVGSLPGVTRIVDIKEKRNIIAYLPPSPGSVTAAAPRERTRQFLKIQDGCNNRCSYCIVPLARGNSVSVPVAEVTAAFDREIAGESQEIVLSGIHIGTYGADLHPRTSLTELAASLVRRAGTARIRLSSIEPNEVTEGILDLLGKGLCRHLHIPLQSGDDDILRSMRRTYASRDYRILLAAASAKVPGLALGADVMVGFPGEGEKEFNNTRSLIEELPLTHLHVFSYSPRPGTPAAKMDHQVPEEIKKQRNAKIREIGRRKNLEFRKSQVGTVQRIVVEDQSEEGICKGLTDNYLRVSFTYLTENARNKAFSVKISNVSREGLDGTVIS
ncbi:MAG: tRNA (N(6)-L-threonylcarbamoyladenosine(37)-C(2))-methylthiotransferase MtaB [Nitrospiraceae bacterium]|nr:tRNA (N(6)-L-threonylcarbamoyladenosine(37)-C(2))-methylthiotransferase MtaB [Nitrospiraceae bacterium]